jgi:hypothetical protein
MKCQAVRFRFENPRHANADLRAAAPEIREHLAVCADCRGFVESQRELGVGVALLRESVPRFTASLDAKVLANYRRQISEPQPLPRFALARRRPFSILYWSAAAAAIALIAILLLARAPKPIETTSTSQPAPAAVTPNPATPATPAVNPSREVARQPISGTRKPTGRRAVKKPAADPSVQPEPLTTTSEEPVPVAFRGLMYCDPLSCGGPMQMIRVQLPFSPGTLLQGSPAGNGVVYADVVVGPDGVARGIRLVQ